jgi:hypothetical protein
MARPTLTMLLAFIPGVTAAILYGFLGNSSRPICCWSRQWLRWSADCWA